MSDCTEEKVDEHIRLGKDALDQGRYEDATAYINIANKDIENQIRRIKKEIPKIAESSESIGRIAGKLEELTNKKKATSYLLEKINKEKDRAKCFRKLVEDIRERKIVETIFDKKKRIDDILDKPRTLNSDAGYFLCLRKWNSYTPFIGASNKARQGGGYFLTWNGRGLVIDPGINFLQNFLNSGYSIADIDTILITHSHVDHTADFEAILTLLQEVNSLRRGHEIDPHKPSIYLNIGAANKFMHLLTSSYENVQKRIILDPNSTHELFPGVTLNTCEAHHSDLYAPQGKCIGLQFSFTKAGKSLNFGITSDTAYSAGLNKTYSNLKKGAIVLHLGSMLEDELQLEMPTKRVYPQHLGIRGVFNLIYDLNPQLAIISEIGEELQSSVCTLSECLGEVFHNSFVLPADIGLRINLSKFGDPFEVECQKCKDFKDIKNVVYSYTPENETIKYVCNNCVHNNK